LGARTLNKQGGNKMPDFLNQQGTIYTSARNNGQNQPITDTSVKESIAYDKADDMFKIKSLQKKWRADFNGSVLNAGKWEVLQTGSGHTITVANSELKINTGTTINSETIIQSTEAFTDPFRAMIGLMISQKIVNQQFYVEAVSVDPVTLVADGLNKASWRIDYADNSSAQYGVYEVQNGGGTMLASSAQYIANAVTSYQNFEIELFSDEVWFHTRAQDSANGRSASFVRQNSAPDPTALYKIRIRAKNLGTAPASATDLKVNFVTVMDSSELTAEITAGRGVSSPGQAIGVQVLNTPTQYVVAGVLGSSSTTNLGASATYTASSIDNGSSTQLYNRFRVSVQHTAGLVPGHLTFEISTDNTNFRETHRIPIPSDGNYRTFDLPITARYFRWKFINGSTAQTSFFIQGMYVRQDGAIDFDKSMTFVHSTTALGISATFTGTTLDLGSNHSINRHRALVFADQTGTVYLEQSRDGSTWRTTATANVTANTPTTLEDMVISRYVRVRYANGGTANTVFELQSALIRQ
jgi:hypothetical protein